MTARGTENLEQSFQVFLTRIQAGIFVLGLELGCLLQGSTVPIQHLALSYVPDRGSQLILSLIWSLMLASTGLGLYFVCQRLVLSALHKGIHYEEEDPNKTKEQDDNHHHQLEGWKVDLHCYFAQGAVLGVFLSWMCVDSFLNFRTQVIYGGIMFLISLLYFSRQMWNKYGCLECSEFHRDDAESSKPKKIDHFTV